MDSSDRNFTDQEVALILRRAIAMHSEQGPQAASEAVDQPDGTSLEVIREIAAEVGVDPALVDRAAASIATVEEVERSRFLGNPRKEQQSVTYGRPLSDVEVHELLDRMRRTLKAQGTVSEVLGAVEWKSAIEADQTVGITIATDDQRTRVQMIADRTLAFGISFFPPTFAGIFGSFVIINEFEPGGNLPALILLIGVLGALAVGRTIWGVWSGVLRRRLERLQAEISEFMAERPTDDSR